MNTKNFMVFILSAVFVLSLVATVCASEELTSDLRVTVDGFAVSIGDNNVNPNTPAVIAGETTRITVRFTSDVNASDVRFKAEIEGNKVDVIERTDSFDVEAGYTYSKTLVLDVPFELKDDHSDDLSLNVKVSSGNDFETEVQDIELRVQRPSYNADIKSISTSQTVEAGSNMPIDIVLKNMGYNELEDLYVTVQVAELGLTKTAYFGDLAFIESCEDDCDKEDTVSGRLYLSVPYSADAGLYDLEVKVTNDDTSSTMTKQFNIANDFAENTVVPSTSKTFSVGETASYDLIIVNPTNALKAYTIVSDSNKYISTSVSDSVFVVPAGSSKTVTITANAVEEGDYSFDVSVLSGNTLEDTVTFNAEVEGQAGSSPIVVLTIVLAVIFLVLLVVLIVLLGRKPQTEDFGESYY